MSVALHGDDGGGKLHALHGCPCANPDCSRLLITNRIHAGVYCDAYQCGPRGLAGQITAKRKAAKAERGAGAAGRKKRKVREPFDDLSNEGPAQGWRPSSKVESLPNLTCSDAERAEMMDMDEAVLAAEVHGLEARLEALQKAAQMVSGRLQLARGIIGLRSLGVPQQLPVPVALAAAEPQPRPVAPAVMEVAAHVGTVEAPAAVASAAAAPAAAAPAAVPPVRAMIDAARSTDVEPEQPPSQPEASAARSVTPQVPPPGPPKNRREVKERIRAAVRNNAAGFWGGTFCGFRLAQLGLTVEDVLQNLDYLKLEHTFNAKEDQGYQHWFEAA